jgi:branched-chain amino acid transport system ATP-binding protein
VSSPAAAPTAGRAAGAPVVLEVEDLQVYYGNIAAVKGVSLSVHEGEIVSLIGSNGAGKSTTLRTISGLLSPRKGKVRFEGQEIQGRPGHEVVRLGIAQSPEGRKIFGRMSVEENLELGAFQRNDRDGIRQDMERVLETFPRLRERLAQRAGTMSGGEQQMLAIGRALMARPRLLMLDEPSLGLAPVLVDLILETVQEINREGTTILMVEQNALAALGVAHHAYVLESGRIKLEGPAADLAKNDEVRQAYLGGA